MGYLKINEWLKNKIEPEIKQNFPTKDYSIALNHWHDNRFILLHTILKDRNIHYEYYQGHVELHMEDKFGGGEYNLLWKELVEESRKHEELSWHRWGNRNQGRCRLNRLIQSPKDIIEGFRYMSEIFDPILSALTDEKNVILRQSEQPELPPPDCMKVDKLKYDIITVKDLPFESLVIPEYQRPYKWGVKNVNQLINDLIAFKANEEYRLGTLVLHDNNIVDGQQRIVTLSLLLHVLFRKRTISTNNPYQEVQNDINTFWKRTTFRNGHSIAHVRENLSAIEERADDLDEDFLNFLLANCKFVVVRLPEISEAFQFFDSQNARGKDLEPHDLLKAFHLREIKALSPKDSDNITAWQGFRSEHLVNLFLSLYRIKRWVKGNNGKEFTKNDIDTFKGISLDDKRYPFYMQQIICHYFSTIYANDSARKIDNSTLEFPFQLDQVCINGSRFFDMICHYDGLYNKISDEKEYKQYDSDEDDKSAFKIISLLNTYKNRRRVGDIYVRQLFDCLMMYYIDRFGFTEINKVTKKIFKYAYRLRLEQYSVQLSSINNSAMNGLMFKTIRDAQSPYDIINLALPPLEEKNLASNADTQIKGLYF